jgi:hypothetical protein
LRDSCVFFNEKETSMPLTMEYLRNRYCKGACFIECALYRIAKVYGKNKVPQHLYPNDMYEIMNFSLIDPGEGLDAFMKIIYTDGTLGLARASSLGGLRRTGKIIAFHCSGGWIEVRRRSKKLFIGVDRRKNKPEKFFTGFENGFCPQQEEELTR